MPPVSLLNAPTPLYCLNDGPPPFPVLPKGPSTSLSCLNVPLLTLCCAQGLVVPSAASPRHASWVGTLLYIFKIPCILRCSLLFFLLCIPPLCVCVFPCQMLSRTCQRMVHCVRSSFHPVHIAAPRLDRAVTEAGARGAGQLNISWRPGGAVSTTGWQRRATREHQPHERRSALAQS